MIPGRTSAGGNDLVKRLVTQNGALSVGMYMDDAAYPDRATDSYYCPGARARTTA